MIAQLLVRDWDYFSKRNLGANIRGLKLGEFGAAHFDGFKDFINDLCPESCKK